MVRPKPPPRYAHRRSLSPRTADGTTLLTHSEDDGLRSFILPPSLLSGDLPPLTPYVTTFTSSRAYAMTLYPTATLSAPDTFIYLCSPRGAPIRLHSLLHHHLLASYQLTNPNTETHDAPYSLLIPPSKPHTFLAGTKNQISIFDLTRSGSGPVTALKTIPTRRSPATTTTMKGLVTALALSEGVLAAGTNTRQVGLYAGDGGGEVVGVFELPEDGDGAGVMQLEWSKCARYLYIAERMSDVVSVYDIRVSGMRLGSFRGRTAGTNQRLGVDVAGGICGELVGGGLDGVVRIWEANHAEGVEGGGECVGSWKAHEDAVTSAVVHPGGSVMATCSGSRKTFGLGGRGITDDSSSSSGSDDTSDDESVKERAWDNSLKIWEIPTVSRTVDLYAP